MAQAIKSCYARYLYHLMRTKSPRQGGAHFSVVNALSTTRFKHIRGLLEDDEHMGLQTATP